MEYEMVEGSFASFSSKKADLFYIGRLVYIGRAT
jgi:hypothetical protein